jgi:hypothetical protein
MVGFAPEPRKTGRIRGFASTVSRSSRNLARRSCRCANATGCCVQLTCTCGPRIRPLGPRTRTSCHRQCTSSLATVSAWSRECTSRPTDQHHAPTDRESVDRLQRVGRRGHGIAPMDRRSAPRDPAIAPAGQRQWHQRARHRHRRARRSARTTNTLHRAYRSTAPNIWRVHCCARATRRQSAVIRPFEKVQLHRDGGACPNGTQTGVSCSFSRPTVGDGAGMDATHVLRHRHVRCAVGLSAVCVPHVGDRKRRDWHSACARAELEVTAEVDRRARSSRRRGSDRAHAHDQACDQCERPGQPCDAHTGRCDTLGGDRRRDDDHHARVHEARHE